MGEGELDELQERQSAILLLGETLQVGNSNGSACCVDETCLGHKSKTFRPSQRVRSEFGAQDDESVDLPTPYDLSEVKEMVESLFNDQIALMQRRALLQQGQRGIVACSRLLESFEGDAEAVTYVRIASDRFIGDARLRAVRLLLSEIDGRGFERSNHQERFHEAFFRACGRVLYDKDWEVHRARIMQQNQWTTSNSEVMISTPRRFGKTFSIAMFVACMAIVFPCEIVVFSPARRASRKLLERMFEVCAFSRTPPVFSPCKGKGGSCKVGIEPRRLHARVFSLCRFLIWANVWSSTTWRTCA